MRNRPRTADMFHGVQRPLHAGQRAPRAVSVLPPPRGAFDAANRRRHRVFIATVVPAPGDLATASSRFRPKLVADVDNSQSNGDS